MNNGNVNMLRKDSAMLPNRQGKRRLITVDELKYELRGELIKLFTVFKNAVEMYNNYYLPKVLPGQKVRNYEAVCFNQCMVTSAFKMFPKGCSFGKYAKFSLRIMNEVLIQFKKLNGKGMPMNIKTVNVDNINHQLALDLFGDQNIYDPILYFGYKKDKVGQFVEPQIIYIDEGKIVFSLSEEQLNNMPIDHIEIVDDQNVDNEGVRIKNNNLRRKTS